MDNLFWGDQHWHTFVAQEQKPSSYGNITLDLRVQYAAWGHTTPLHNTHYIKGKHGNIRPIYKGLWLDLYYGIIHILRNHQRGGRGVSEWLR